MAVSKKNWLESLNRDDPVLQRLEMIRLIRTGMPPEKIAEQFNAVRVVRFLESGHWVPAEIPDRVSNELQSFLGS